MGVNQLYKRSVEKRFLWMLVLVLTILLIWQSQNGFPTISRENKSDFIKTTIQATSMLPSYKPVMQEKIIKVSETEDEFLKRMALRMKYRQAKLKGACKKFGLPKEPFHPQNFMEAKRYNLLHCRIPKAGSTNMDRVYASLVNIEDYHDLPHRMPNSPHKMEFITEKNFQLNETSKYVTSILVRDPFVRLISSFTMKVTKGTSKEYRIKERWEGKSAIPINITFKDYVEHLIFKPGPYNTLERHWALFYDLCQPCHVHYDVISTLETIEEDSRYLLTRIGAPRNISFTHGYGSDGHSQTSSSDINKFFKQVKRPRLKALYRVYQRDFELFDYPMPKQIFQ